MEQYETIIIIDPDVESENIEGIIEDVQNLISGSGGEIVKVDRWGKRRLAYEVKGNRDGVYVLISFKADPQFIQRLERYYGLTEQIIKYMNVKAEELSEPGEVKEEAIADEDQDEESLYEEDEEDDEEQ